MLLIRLIRRFNRQILEWPVAYQSTQLQVMLHFQLLALLEYMRSVLNTQITPAPTTLIIHTLNMVNRISNRPINRSRAITTTTFPLDQMEMVEPAQMHLIQ